MPGVRRMTDDSKFCEKNFVRFFGLISRTPLMTRWVLMERVDDMVIVHCDVAELFWIVPLLNMKHGPFYNTKVEAKFHVLEFGNMIAYPELRSRADRRA